MRFEPLPALLTLALAGCTATDGNDHTPATPAAPYTLQVFDAVRINSHQDQPNFQVATAEVDFHDGPFAKATLIADLESPCFPFTTWRTSPPPKGQNWPADCDAFDRNFEFTLDPPADKTGAPGIELVRAITPFGGPMHLEVPITDVVNGRPGKHTVRVNINTWSDAKGSVSGSNGGWAVTARIELTPGTPAHKVLGVFPLFNGNVTTADGPGPLEFTMPEGTKHARIDYRATGHGGAEGDGDCIGPAEEFCRRVHHVTVDGAQIEALEPWRDDCKENCTLVTDDPVLSQDYCQQNPCGAIGSVKAPRANWCPGTLTPPFTWSDSAVPALAQPGKHTFSWTISTVAQGGSWRASAVVFAFGE